MPAPAAHMHWIDTAGTGGVIAAGPRGNDAFAINGNAIVYDTGKILKVGGAPAYKSGRATDAQLRHRHNRRTRPRR